MRIASFLIIALIVSAAGGLGVASTIASGYNQLRDIEEGAGQDSVARARVKGFRSSAEQVLVTGDLLMGSEVRYLAPGVSKQIESLLITLGEIRQFSLLSESAAELDQVQEALELIREVVGTYMSSGPEVGDALNVYDTAAFQLANLVDELEESATSRAQATLALVRTESERHGRHRILLFSGYCAMMILLLITLLRQIASPVRKLTINAEDAMELGHRFQPVNRGPRELKQLGGTISRFVGDLETKVAERTVALRTQADELKGEIEGRRRVEEQLRTAMIVAETASAAKSEFLSVMSHELRTPMNAILGTLTLLGDTPLEGEQRVYIETARNSGSALMALLNDVLDMSKIEAGYLELASQDVDVFETIDHVLSLFHPTCCSKRVVLAGVVSPRVPSHIRGDSLRIRQVLTNLVGNAAKFTDDGHIHLRADTAQNAIGEGVLRFSVSDTGVGIARQNQSIVFTEFSQVDKSYTRRHGGTGLGLSISRRLVESMGGEIGVHSTEGAGSEFWFTVPLQDVNTDALPHADLRERLAGLNVVIAGSCYVLAKSLQELLDDWVGSARVETDPGRWAELLSGSKPNTSLIVCGPPDAHIWSEYAGLLNEYGHPGPRLAVVPCVPGAAAMVAEQAEFDVIYDQALKPATILRAVCGDGPKSSDHVAPALPQGTGGKVLLVEDSPANQMVASAMLEKAGFTVSVATNGKEAIDAVKADCPDLVLMDLQMPVMDGYAAAVAIRELPGICAEVPIVALTANVMAESDAGERGVQLDGYLSKPLSRRVLLETVVSWMERSSTPSEIAGTAKAGSNEAKL
jgi:signal transduction histidine kinase/AmiR/NasT family two-component response regulator